MIDVSEDTFDLASTDKDSIARTFTCIICQRVAFTPVKCEGCETIYCSRCLPDEAFNNLLSVKSRVKYTCHKMCGSNRVAELGRIERNILNSLSFRCQHSSKGCTATVRYQDMHTHLTKECVKRIQNYKVEKPKIKYAT